MAQVIAYSQLNLNAPVKKLYHFNQAKLAYREKILSGLKILIFEETEMNL